MIKIRDKVKIKGQDIVMTVLSFDRDNVLPSSINWDVPQRKDKVVCGWIADDAWQTTSLDPDVLEVVPQEESVGLPCAVGDVVTLMSSNVRMTVVAVGDVSALCVWFNPDNLLQERQFPFNTLSFARS